VTAPDYRTPTTTPTTQDDAIGVGQSGVAQDARDRGIEVGQHAKSAAADVKDSATERARDVVGEASAQARDLVSHTRDTLAAHADEQAGRLSETIEQLADELRTMASSSDQNGIASRVVGELADRADALAVRMRGRSSTDLLEDLRDLGRRRPGAFIAGAAGLGMLVGRLGRGLKDASSNDSNDAWASSTYRGTGYRTGTDYSTAGLGIGQEPVSPYPTTGTAYGTGAGTGYPAATGYETGTGASTGYETGTGASTGYEAGTGAGTATGYETGTGYGRASATGDTESTSEFGAVTGDGRGFDKTGLEAPDPDVAPGTGERPAGGSSYGA
jgi:vacuolar-type H+-ATPase subunit H